MASQKKRKILIRIAIVVVLVLVAVFTVRGIQARYFFFEGRALLRSSASLDLRDLELTLVQYEQIKAELPGCNIRWMIPMGDGIYDSAAIAINVSSIDSRDIPMYMFFDDLQRVYAETSGDYTALQELQRTLPNCEVLWMVHLGNRSFDPEAAELVLNDTGVTAGEMLQKLSVFSGLNRVEITDVTFSAQEQSALAEKYPDISFVWNVEVSGKTWCNTETSLSYADTEVDAQALAAAANRLPNVTSIDLSGCGCTIDELLLIQNAYNARITSELELYGISFDTAATELDFSDIPMEDVSQIEKMLPLLPNLQKVVMCNCGISSEEMDALWKRHPQVRFIWSVQIGKATLRTDCTNFTPPKHGYLANGKIVDHFKDKHNRLFDEDVKELKYCVDMVCLDLGHMGISDYSFLQYMPKLKYLILADTIGTDFSYMKDLKELIFLELFLTDFKDTEVLLSLTALEDLNIAYTDVSEIEHFKQMPWLKRLWVSYSKLDYKQCRELQKYIPNTKIDCDAEHPTANNWRKSKNYYDMRDYLGMYYLD